MKFKIIEIEMTSNVTRIVGQTEILQDAIKLANSMEENQDAPYVKSYLVEVNNE
jgi:hypothetical protein